MHPGTVGENNVAKRIGKNYITADHE